MAQSSIDRSILQPLASKGVAPARLPGAQAAKEEAQQQCDGEPGGPAGKKVEQDTDSLGKSDDQHASMGGMNADAHLAEAMDKLVLQDEARKDGWAKAKEGKKGPLHMDARFVVEQKHWETGQEAYMTSQLDLELRDLPRLYSPPRNYSITVDQRWAKFYGAHPGLARNCIAARLCFCNTNETDIETWVADKIEGGLLGIHPHTNTKLYLKSEAFGNTVTMLLTREMIFRCDWDNPEHVILRGLAAAEKIGNYDRIDLQEPMWEGMSARAGGGYHVVPSAFQHPNNKRVFAPGFDSKMAKLPLTCTGTIKRYSSYKVGSYTIPKVCG